MINLGNYSCADIEADVTDEGDGDGATADDDGCDG